ncbi:hypothetical protein NUW54_g10734 [Trametes sanguinea]|uniref:Uncharacterized protein n=1 Tax=Trametes sanguinea TaxID=158606 RepID=A0ACC1NUX1_9APHY|nr:hypothetical protein NUW54_g10734 [Trametes sanguinea]
MSYGGLEPSELRLNAPEESDELEAAALLSSSEDASQRAERSPEARRLLLRLGLSFFLFGLINNGAYS